jgi:hypothetical protein
MKKNRKLTCVIAIAMVLTIAFSGVALASAVETSFTAVVNDGSLRMETRVISTTEGDVPPYDETGYAFRAITQHGNSEVTRTLNTNTGVDAQTHFKFIPLNNLKKAYIEEEVKTARVAEGENHTVCCDARAQTRFLTSGVNYESAAFSEDNDLLYVMNAIGYGRGMVESEENKQIGNGNTTWQDTRTLDRFTVRGIWDVSAEVDSQGCSYPAQGIPKKDMLCPFMRP